MAQKGHIWPYLLLYCDFATNFKHDFINRRHFDVFHQLKKSSQHRRHAFLVPFYFLLFSSR
jgi:hypothetical protein